MPAAAMAQDYEESSYDEPAAYYSEPASAAPASGMGFSLMVNLGGTIAAENLSSGYQTFDANVGGFQGTIDVGLKFNRNFAMYLEGIFRAAFATEPSMDSHCPAWGSKCYRYKSLKDGEWDHHSGGLGILLLGLIPVNDSVTFQLGGGGLILIGDSIDGREMDSIFAIKAEAGILFNVTDKFALGLSISGESNLVDYHAFSPYLTLSYNP